MSGLPAIDVLLYAAVAAAPVWAWRLASPRAWEPLLGWSVGLTAGVFGLPLIAWSVAVLAGTHIGPGLLLGVAATVVASGAIAGRLQAGRRTA